MVQERIACRFQGRFRRPTEDDGEAEIIEIADRHCCAFWVDVILAFAQIGSRTRWSHAVCATTPTAEFRTVDSGHFHAGAHVGRLWGDRPERRRSSRSHPELQEDAA